MIYLLRTQMANEMSVRITADKVEAFEHHPHSYFGNNTDRILQQIIEFGFLVRHFITLSIGYQLHRVYRI